MSEIRDNRANLSLCWRMAEQAPSELERRAWLDMAESWRLLVITDDPWSIGDLFDAHQRVSPFRNSVIDTAGMHCWFAVRWRRYLLKYRMIREKAASLVLYMF
jgi:hypothetical protein